MKIFAVLETADVEVQSLRAYAERTAADETFDACCEENGVQETHPDGLEREAPGTVRIAGDDAFAVQMFEIEVA